MIDRPKKKEISKNKNIMESMDKMDCTFDNGDCREIGYNQACDDYKKWILQQLEAQEGEHWEDRITMTRDLIKEIKDG